MECLVVTCVVVLESVFLQIMAAVQCGVSPKKCKIRRTSTVRQHFLHYTKQVIRRYTAFMYAVHERGVPS